MIKVSVTCANEDGKNFDMDYYCNNLMPMVHEKLGDALLKSEVVEEIGGTPAAYVAIGHIHFDSVYR
ncbi:MAG: EthD family reductase, partial [Pseudomonadota bacterium]|nr:EthD family reductase [Pseudomonadota bacterium]